MRLFRFELRKALRQKRFLWPFVVIILLTCGLLYYNGQHQDETKENLISKAESYSMEAGSIYTRLREKKNAEGLNAEETKKMEIIDQMATDIFQWKSTIQDENWEELPKRKHAFLESLQPFEDAGGSFRSLEGILREEAIVKNTWLLDHDLAYEDDTHPISPALITKETGDILLGVTGIVLLVLIFGATITEEKEKNTWLTLKTIPASKWSRVLAKYGVTLCMILLYIVLILFSGWLLAILFGNGGWNYQFPHVYTDFFDGVHAISIQTYLLRLVGLFLCATVFAFAFVFLLSTRMKHSFSMFLCTGFILLIGYMITDIQPVLQAAWNPFQFFRIQPFMETVPQAADWMYGLSAAIWSIALIGMGIALPEKDLVPSKRSSVSPPFKKGKTKQRKNVWEIVLFEWRKLKRRGLFKQFLMLFFLFIIIGYIVIHQQSEEKKQSYIDGLHQTIDTIDNISIPSIRDDRIPSLEEELQEAKDADDHFQASQIKSQIRAWEQDVETYQETRDSKQLALQAIEEKDWQTLYQQQRFQAEINRGEHDSPFFLRGIQELSDLSGKASIEEKDWLMEHHVHPIFSGISVNAIYEDWGQDKKEFQEEWEKGNKKVDSSGLFSLYHFFQYGIGSLFLFLLLFLTAMGFANERGKNPTIQFLQVQPLSRRSVFFGKYIHAGAVTLLSSLGIFLFVILLGAVFNRFGDRNYPILHYNSDTVVQSDAYNGLEALEGGYNFMPLGTFLTETITLFLCVVLAVIALTHVLSFLKIHVFGVLAVALFISIGGYFGSLELGDYAAFSPFTYFNITKIINGELSTTLDQPAISFVNGCWVLLAFTAVLLVAGYVFSKGRYKKRNSAGKTVEKTS